MGCWHKVKSGGRGLFNGKASAGAEGGPWKASKGRGERKGARLWVEEKQMHGARGCLQRTTKMTRGGRK